MNFSALRHGNDDAPLDDSGWSDFPGVEARRSRLDEFAAVNAGKSVLITGAAGSIGAGLSRAVLAAGPRRLILLDSSEYGLHALQAALQKYDAASAEGCTWILGDVCDRSLLADVFDRERPQMVYHVAAFKQVPLSEQNPLAFLRNNVLGTYAVSQTALRHSAEQMILISTDKAVHPHSLMGASKRLAELVMLGLSMPELPMKAVRFGNVLGSRGSVVPVFAEQIASGGPVTVTDPEARRFFLTLRHAVELILLAASTQVGGIFVPNLSEQTPILKLAQYLIGKAGFHPDQIPIIFTGLRPGDKKDETFVSDREVRQTMIENEMSSVKSAAISAAEVHALMQRLEGCLEHRDLLGAMQLLGKYVPEYQPSEVLLKACGQGVASA